MSVQSMLANDLGADHIWRYAQLIMKDFTDGGRKEDFIAAVKEWISGHPMPYRSKLETSSKSPITDWGTQGDTHPDARVRWQGAYPEVCP